MNIAARRITLCSLMRASLMCPAMYKLHERLTKSTSVGEERLVLLQRYLVEAKGCRLARDSYILNPS